MTRFAKNSLYYADDKDIYDLLQNHQKTVTKRELLELARSRGVFLSHVDSYDELADFISSLTFDWPNLSKLYDLIHTTDRTEKTTSSVLTSKITTPQLSNILNHISNTRQEDGSEAYRITQSPNAISVEVTYSEVPDPARSRLEQRRERKLVIHVETKDDGLHIRHEANKKAEEIVSAISTAIEKKTGNKVEQARIELSGIRSPQDRTAFFLALMKQVRGYKLSNVTDVSVDKLGTNPDDERNSDEPPEGIERVRTREDIKMTGVVKSWIKGENLLQTKHYQDLTHDEFFISHAVWIVEREKGAPQQIIFEAEFGNPQSATNFRYALKGTREPRKDGYWKKTITPIKESDKGELSLLIEEAARVALRMITSTATARTEALAAPAAAGSRA
ncbi:hypothetical protein MYSTI_03248 [Myxococcus stipitatus DSM 14675]|uniref:Uncharacterized protein n=1 Tax=Myxococcus stipitatus (strain DSM 14675 / JCM 12634 / Mx s8) TaxID=1278073 RepID=L7U9N4_MYXSD|nr:hypothetical protein [Myxococcus stipitatus]AGC44560.1 hypothetical protein MYSTI_03248 [Myxococcus stipitatus DSM 14675]